MTSHNTVQRFKFKVVIVLTIFWGIWLKVTKWPKIIATTMINKIMVVV